MVVQAHGGQEGPFYLPCTNRAVTYDHFILDPLEQARAEDHGAILAIVHSHPGTPPLPGDADKTGCEHTGLPWIIVNWPTGKIHQFEPIGFKAPLVGREFLHGVLDCFTLIKDWYAIERGIELPDFDRPSMWWDHGLNLYLDHYAEAGFYKVDAERITTGDVVLMRIKSPVPNHAGIYLGGGLILHHLMGRLSQRAVYNQGWQRMTTHVLRFGGAT